MGRVALTAMAFGCREGLLGFLRNAVRRISFTGLERGIKVGDEGFDLFREFDQREEELS